MAHKERLLWDDAAAAAEVWALGRRAGTAGLDTVVAVNLPEIGSRPRKYHFLVTETVGGVKRECMLVGLTLSRRGPVD